VPSFRRKQIAGPAWMSKFPHEQRGTDPATSPVVWTSAAGCPLMPAMPANSDSITVPSQHTSPAASDKSTLAIRWVFPDQQGTLSILDDRHVFLGRQDDCQLRLEGDEVSRLHAEIRWEHPLHILRDLDSRNGVYLNGARIHEAAISAGKVVRLGECVGVLVDVPVDLVDPQPVYGTLVGDLAGGPVLRPILDQARIVAGRPVPTVIVGETGTGKEGVSHAIHDCSGRKGPFLAVNCATLVPSLAEAELFGYRKGAFTGADHANPGYFRAAQGGTLLLDEIADLPEAVQGKLLRAIENKEIFPIGESQPVAVDVRVLAATQTPLTELVEQRRFRADLCARLNALTVRLPPLRERKQEIVYLFWHLLRRHSGGHLPRIDARLAEALCLYDWPFNVRELDLVAQELLVWHDRAPVLRRSHLPEHILDRMEKVRKDSSESNVVVSDEGAASKAPVAKSPESDQARREREVNQFAECLRKHKGNVSRAAAEMGISRQRAYRLMSELGGVAPVREALGAGKSADSEGDVRRPS
jgi:DNA-binding NtrC family response regulator